MKNKEKRGVNRLTFILVTILIANLVWACVCHHRLAVINYKIEASEFELSRERLNNTRLKAGSPPLVESAKVDHLRAELEKVQSRLKTEAKAELPQPIKTSAQFQNAGRISPSATAETLFWALNGGDQTVLANSIVLNPVLKERLDKIWGSLAPDTKSQFKSTEEFAATLLSVGEPIASMQSASLETGPLKQSDGSIQNAAVASFQVQYSNGEKGNAKMSFIQTEAGWKWMVPMNIMMDKFEAVISGKFPFKENSVK